MAETITPKTLDWAKQYASKHRSLTIGQLQPESNLTHRQFLISLGVKLTKSGKIVNYGKPHFLDLNDGVTLNQLVLKVIDSAQSAARVQKQSKRKSHVPHSHHTHLAPSHFDNPTLVQAIQTYAGHKIEALNSKDPQQASILRKLGCFVNFNGEIKSTPRDWEKIRSRTVGDVLGPKKSKWDV